jgi:hypothetical protein
MKKIVVSTLSLASLIALGCSKPEPVDRNESGTLSASDPKVQQDQSPYDDYTFDADEGWLITGEMRSTVFDTYLWLIGPNGESIVQDDDGLNDGTNSRVTHTTTERGTYTMRANSYDRAGPWAQTPPTEGAYTLHIVAGPPAGN